jgi:hypothetical protein
VKWLILESIQPLTMLPPSKIDGESLENSQKQKNSFSGRENFNQKKILVATDATSSRRATKFLEIAKLAMKLLRINFFTIVFRRKNFSLE